MQESSPITSKNFLAGESLQSVESALKGDNPHVFRVMEAEMDRHDSPLASVRVDGYPGHSPQELATVEPTFLQHESVTGVPFTASYLGLDKSFDKLSIQDQEHIKSVDEYISQKISSGTFKDSAEAAAALIREIESKINLKDYHDPYYKAEKISSYLENLVKYQKQQTVRARISQESLKEQKQQTQTVKRLEKKIGNIIPDTSLQNKKIDQITRQTKELSRKLIAPDLSPIQSELRSLEGRTTPALQALHTKVDALISLQRESLEKADHATDVAYGAYAETQQFGMRTNGTKQALSRLLESL